MTTKKVKVLSPKLVSPGFGVISHWCPGCKRMHHFLLKDDNPDRPDDAKNKIAEWDNNVVNPTFSTEQEFNSDTRIYTEIKRPDKITAEQVVNFLTNPVPKEVTIDAGESSFSTVKCIYNLTNGKLNYSLNSTHEYSGRAIDLPDIPQDVLDEILNPKTISFTDLFKLSVTTTNKGNSE